MGCLHSVPVNYDDRESKTLYGHLKDVQLSPNVEQALQNARIQQLSQGGTSHSFSITPRSTTTSISAITANRKSYVGADLHSIMDDQGMLNPLVSRQLSILSHYSVKSESGSVMITPEGGGAPFKLLRLIGRGGFGNVYLGDWNTQRVAVKVIQGNTNTEQPEEQEWEARKERMAQMEAILMSAINHPNVVNTLKVTSHSGTDIDMDLAAVERQLLKSQGGVDEPETTPTFEWHIIMEYCDKGSLSKALSTFRFHEPVDSTGVTARWDVWSSIETLKEIVRALIFLHENRILHGDLKAANVLLATSDLDRRGFIAKVSDFGLSRVLQTNKNHIKTQTFGTVTHMPPELLSKGTLSPTADVYAVGVLMWEIYTAEKVFKQLSDSEVILAVVTKKARPTFPHDVPSRYKFLAERCWSEMPELRPSLEQLAQELENLQANLCPQGSVSPMPVVKTYPSRQKQLQELWMRQQQQAAQREQHKVQQAALHQPHQPHHQQLAVSQMPIPMPAHHAGAGHHRGPAAPTVARSHHSQSRLSRSNLNNTRPYDTADHGINAQLQVQQRTASYTTVSRAQPNINLVRTQSFAGAAAQKSGQGAALQPLHVHVAPASPTSTSQNSFTASNGSTPASTAAAGSPRGPSLLSGRHERASPLSKGGQAQLKSLPEQTTAVVN